MIPCGNNIINIMDSMDDLNNIVKEGNLEKQSRFIKSWRKRWVVLTPKTLYTFKNPREYTNPTEAISLKEITSIKSCEEETQKQHTFKVEVDERSFYFGAASSNEKETWIGQIGKAMVKLNIKKEVDFE